MNTPSIANHCYEISSRKKHYHKPTLKGIGSQFQNCRHNNTGTEFHALWSQNFLRMNHMEYFLLSFSRIETSYVFTKDTARVAMSTQFEHYEPILRGNLMKVDNKLDLGGGVGSNHLCNTRSTTWYHFNRGLVWLHQVLPATSTYGISEPPAP